MEDFTQSTNRLRVYLGCSLRQFDDPAYPAVVKALRSHFDFPVEIIEAKTSFTSNADWGHRWAELLATLDVMVLWLDGRVVGMGTYRELRDCHEAGIPVLPYQTRYCDPSAGVWLRRFGVWLQPEQERSPWDYALVGHAPPSQSPAPAPNLIFDPRAARVRLRYRRPQLQRTRASHIIVAAFEPETRRYFSRAGHLTQDQWEHRWIESIRDESRSLAELAGATTTNPTLPQLAAVEAETHGAPASLGKPFSELSPEQKRLWNRATLVAGRVSRGESLSRASRAEHMHPETVLRCRPAVFTKFRSGYLPEGHGWMGRGTVWVNVVTPQGFELMPIRSASDRKQLRLYLESVERLLSVDPNVRVCGQPELAHFEGQYVRDADGVRHPFLTDAAMLRELAQAGQVELPALNGPAEEVW